MNRAHWVAWAGWVAVAALLASGGVARGQATTGGDKAAGASEPQAAPTADQLEAQLREKAAAGKFTNEVVDLFLAMADARARERLVPGTASEEFWTWLAGHKAVHKALLADLHPAYKPGAVTSLATLHEQFEPQVEKHLHLALAFALVYGRAGDKPVSAGWSRVKDRTAAPGLAESFGYYMDHRRMMRYPLDKLPWPLLVFVADNDTPIAERKWTLLKYQKLAPAGFGAVYYDVPYDMDGLKRGAGQSGLAINRHPYTLQNIVQYGGVCADRAYYSSRVLKSLGVPAVSDAGEGQRGGHAWLAWVAVKGGKTAMDFSGRWDFDKYYTGQVYDPLRRRRVLDRDVELITAAVNQSCDGFVDTLIACHVYRMTAGDHRTEAAGLLKDALNRRNHYCADAWRLLAKAVADEAVSQKEGEQIYSIMAKPFAGYPDLTFEMLGSLLGPRMRVEGAVEASEVKRNVLLLDKAFAVYEAAKRPDLAVKLRVLQGRYLEATANQDKALKLYVTASQQYVASHFGFIDLFDRAMALMAADDKQAMKMKYLDFMVKTVPKYQGEFNRDTGDVNDAYIHVVKAYAAALEAAGKTDEAARWKAEAAAGDKKG